MTDRLMTPEEVADWMQVTVEWVHAMAREEQMPALKLGRYWRFERAEVYDWLLERSTTPRSRRT